MTEKNPIKVKKNSIKVLCAYARYYSAMGDSTFESDVLEIEDWDDLDDLCAKIKQKLSNKYEGTKPSSFSIFNIQLSTDLKFPRNLFMDLS